MRENKLAELSMELAVNTIQLADSIKGHYSLTNQLERSVSSIGANIRESNYANSRADFIAKLHIALKECYETEFWFELFEKTGLASDDKIKPLYNQCGTIHRILVSSINTAKENAK